MNPCSGSNSSARIKLLIEVAQVRLLNMKKRRTRYEHLNLDIFWTGRPWYSSPGVPIKDKGVPRDVADLPRLGEAIKKALVELGAREVSFSNPRIMYDSYKECERCGTTFECKRITARFCPECRSSYERRVEQPGYAEVNRKRALAGMRQLREGGHSKYKVQKRRSKKR
jgi:hypothetical protein